MRDDDSCPKTTETRVENEDIADARLAAIRVVYEQYRYMDDTIMDPLFLVGDEYCYKPYRQTIRTLWVAIKQAMEGEHD